MRRVLVLFSLLLMTTSVLAEEVSLETFDWTLTPERVVERLSESDAETRLRTFAKTGAPYVTSTIRLLGNVWSGTLYSDDDDNLNQVLLQLEDVSRSQVTRVQKLAVAKFGTKYTTEVKQGRSRTDTNFQWILSDRTVLVSSVRYKDKEQGLVWVKLTPH